VARKPELLAPLGPLEEEILKHLWHVGEGEVIDVHRAVTARTTTSVNTVGSALERLHRKGLLTRVKISHAYRYKPAITREKFFAMRVIASAGGVKALTSRGLLASFLDVVSESDAKALDELEALIAAKRRESKS
jgi:predicted transcriptional regulator